MTNPTCRLFLSLIVAAFALVGAPNVLADVLDDLAPGQWYRVPNSKLAALDPCPANNCSYSAIFGLEGIMSAWSGAAFDRTRGRLIIFGGGHRDYYGNDVYAFDVNALHWSTLRQPTFDVGGNEASGFYPDGTPRSRHTYNSLEYAPAIDSLLAFSAPGTAPNSNSVDTIVHALNLAGAPVWSRKQDVPVSGTRFGVTSLDPVSGDIWHQASGVGQLGRFKPATNTWQIYGSRPMKIYATSAFDPVRKKMLVIGGTNGGQAYAWDLSTNNPTATDLLQNATFNSTNAYNLQARAAPGVAFDEASDQYVIWDGGASVYTIDPDTWTVAQRPPAATNNVVPTPPSARGTYGRFRYVPSRNLFILVNATDEDVYFYRLSTGNGSPAPPVVALGAAPNPVARGGSVTLSWNATNAMACTAFGGWEGNYAPAGTQSVPAVTGDTRFELRCSGPGGSVTAAVDVVVSDSLPGPGEAPGGNRPRTPQLEVGRELPLWGFAADSQNGYFDPDDVSLASSQWEFALDSGFGNVVFSRVVAGRTSCVIPAGVMDPGVSYHVRTRHWNSRGAASLWSAPVVMTSARRYPNDADDNGIDDAFQTPAGADANANGVADVSEGLCNLYDAQGRNVVGFEASAGVVRCFRSVPTSQLPDTDALAGDLPFGAFSFRVEGLTVDTDNPARAQVTVWMPRALNPATGWLIFDPASDEWLDYSSNVTFDDKRVIISYTDGGPGDKDGVVNGVIVDPSGPLVPAATTGPASPVPTPAPTTGGGGGAPSPWAPIALGGLWLARRRTARGAHRCFLSGIQRIVDAAGYRAATASLVQADCGWRRSRRTGYSNISSGAG